MHILLQAMTTAPSWISRRGRITIEMMSWSIHTKVWWLSWDSNLQPLDLQWNWLWTVLWTGLWSLAKANMNKMCKSKELLIRLTYEAVVMETLYLLPMISHSWTKTFIFIYLHIYLFIYHQYIFIHSFIYILSIHSFIHSFTFNSYLCWPQFISLYLTF